MLEDSKRAEAIMARRQMEQRAAARCIINQPAKVLLGDGNGDAHVALVRDVSETGLFFYSDFRPMCGERMLLRFLMPGLDGKVPMECHAEVVRVEAGAQGAAVGIGARMHAKQFRHAAEA